MKIMLVCLLWLLFMWIVAKALCWAEDDRKLGSTSCLLIFAVVFGLSGWASVASGPFQSQLKTWEERRVQREVEDARNAVPFVTQEVDGCKVYAFKSTGNWHYFTRCKDTTTTDTTIEYRSGKTTKTRVESAITNNLKGE